MKKIQVSTIAEKRDQYTQQFEENSKKEYTWIKREPQVAFIEKFVNEFLTHSKASLNIFVLDKMASLLPQKKALLP